MRENRCRCRAVALVKRGCSAHGAWPLRAGYRRRAATLLRDKSSFANAARTLSSVPHLFRLGTIFLTPVIMWSCAACGSFRPAACAARATASADWFASTQLFEGVASLLLVSA